MQKSLIVLFFIAIFSFADNSIQLQIKDEQLSGWQLIKKLRVENKKRLELHSDSNDPLVQEHLITDRNLANTHAAELLVSALNTTDSLDHLDFDPDDLPVLQEAIQILSRKLSFSLRVDAKMLRDSHRTGGETLTDNEVEDLKKSIKDRYARWQNKCEDKIRSLTQRPLFKY